MREKVVPYEDVIMAQSAKNCLSSGATLLNRRVIESNGLIPAIVAGGFLLLALPSHWPYFFYVLMRLTVCAIALYLAHNAFTGSRKMWVWLFGAIAVLFNPLIPIRMHRSDWSALDMIAASIFALWLMVSLFRDRKRTRV